jgi:DNA-binding PadR family transcriptional regulator
LGENTYGALIRQLLHEQINRDVAIGALYSTLERLEQKSLVSSALGVSTAACGGRAKRYFTVSIKGQAALKRSRDAMDNLWSGVSICCMGEL